MPLSVTISWIGLRGDNFAQVTTEIFDSGRSTGSFEINVTILETVVHQLASLFYNLTTCPVPKQERIYQIFTVANSILVSR